MPMWCFAYDYTNDNRNPYRPHHRIVRVPPGESVVLNSAERAPYLLLLEILHDDLDFDPSKRANKPLLKEIVRKDLCAISKSPLVVVFSTYTSWDNRAFTMTL